MGSFWLAGYLNIVFPLTPPSPYSSYPVMSYHDYGALVRDWAGNDELINAWPGATYGKFLCFCNSGSCRLICPL